MGFGQLPISPDFRFYYQLENTTDSGVNGFNCFTVGTVNFNEGRFANSADFGSSGTGASISYDISNVLSALTVPNLTVSIWVKWNNASAANTNTSLWQIATSKTLNVGTRFLIFYNYNGGTNSFDLNARQFFNTTNAEVLFSIPANTTEWYNIVYVKSGLTLTVYVNGFSVGTSTGVGAEYNPSGNYAYLTLANRQTGGYTAQAWIKADYFTGVERALSASEIRKYYTQAKGRFQTFQ